MSGSRFDRELDELLANLGDWTPRESRRQRIWRHVREWQAHWQEAVARLRWSGIPTDQMMLGGILMIVFAYFLRLAIALAAAYVGLLGILLFFVAFGLAIRGGQRRRELRWRGRSVGPYGGGSSLLARLRFWWRRNWR